jgi:histidinol phosphatase-like PHP family hydrolase
LNKISSKRIDLHIHSLLSDGELLPVEILRRAEALNYEAIAITDHVDQSNLESVVSKIVKFSEELEKEDFKTKFYPGVELTHIPPKHIPKMAVKARKLGVLLVIVHGETLVEPVKPNTNHVAVECGEVDILAHPGLITLDDCETAKNNDVYLELTTRKGHCLANGYVAKTALKTGAKLLVNTDLHSPEDFVSQEFAFKVALAAGLEENQAIRVIEENPRKLLKKLG